MSFLDFFFLIALAFSIWNGYARGLVSGLTRLLAYLLAIALATRVAVPVGAKLADWLNLQAMVMEMLTAQVPGTIGNMQVTPEQVLPILQRIHIPPSYHEQILASLPHSTLLEALATPYVNLLAMILGLVLVATFLFVLLIALTAAAARRIEAFLPRFLNRTGGVVLGFGLGLVELAFIALFLSLLADLPTLTLVLGDSITASKLMTPLTALADTLLHRMGAYDLFVP